MRDRRLAMHHMCGHLSGPSCLGAFSASRWRPHFTPAHSSTATASARCSACLLHLSPFYHPSSLAPDSLPQRLPPVPLARSPIPSKPLRPLASSAVPFPRFLPPLGLASGRIPAPCTFGALLSIRFPLPLPRGSPSGCRISPDFLFFGRKPPI
jgi:hypothetical protein